MTDEEYLRARDDMITTTPVTLYFDGKPLASGQIEADLELPESVSTQLFPKHFKASFTCEGTGSLDAFVSLQPTAAPAVDMTIPWGILGPIKIRGFVAHSTFRGGGSAHEVSMSLQAPERREISMAVQRAITVRSARVGAVSRAHLGADKALRRLADVVLRKRGERKKRRAMRRLLRAAGITKPLAEATASLPTTA